MKVQDIDIVHNIWGKDIEALNGKTTGKKPIHVAGDIVKIPKEIVNLHEEIFMTAGMFLVNGIPFILLSLNITFTAVIHPEYRKSIKIFKSSNEIYMYDLKRVFQIKTLHVYGEFEPIQALIKYMSGVPRVYIASNSEHVQNEERRIQVEKESIRYITHSLPFNKVSKIFLINLVFQAIKIMNHFPVKGVYLTL